LDERFGTCGKEVLKKHNPSAGLLQPWEARASQAAEKLKTLSFLSEAKNRSLFVLFCLNRREILRFAQNDRKGLFFAPCSACGVGACWD
jgi:hypothetical protein